MYKKEVQRPTQVENFELPFGGKLATDYRSNHPKSHNCPFTPSELRGTPARTVSRLAVRGIAGEVTIARPTRLEIFRSRDMGRV
jgi:hypothetical protein